MCGTGPLPESHSAFPCDSVFLVKLRRFGFRKPSPGTSGSGSGAQRVKLAGGKVQRTQWAGLVVAATPLG